MRPTFLVKLLSAFVVFTMPKSINLGISSSVTKILDGLISLCIILNLWRYSKLFAISQINLACNVYPSGCFSAIY